MRTHRQGTHECFWSDLQMFLCAVVVMMILVSTGTSSSNYLLMALSPSTPPLVSSTAGTVSHSFRHKHTWRHSARPMDKQTHVHMQLGRNQLTQTNKHKLHTHTHTQTGIHKSRQTHPDSETIHTQTHKGRAVSLLPCLGPWLICATYYPGDNRNCHPWEESVRCRGVAMRSLNFYTEREFSAITLHTHTHTQNEWLASCCFSNQTHISLQQMVSQGQSVRTRGGKLLMEVKQNGPGGMRVEMCGERRTTELKTSTKFDCKVCKQNCSPANLVKLLSLDSISLFLKGSTR